MYNNNKGRYTKWNRAKDPQKICIFVCRNEVIPSKVIQNFTNFLFSKIPDIPCIIKRQYKIVFVKLCLTAQQFSISACINIIIAAYI